MKRLFALLLALVMCLSLCACGSNEEDIKKALIGDWIHYGGIGAFAGSQTYSFAEDGRVLYIRTDTMGTDPVKVGNYEIEDGYIEIVYSQLFNLEDDSLTDYSGSHSLEYTYIDGVFRLYIYSNTELTKVA